MQRYRPVRFAHKTMGRFHALESSHLSPRAPPVRPLQASTGIAAFDPSKISIKRYNQFRAAIRKCKLAGTKEPMGLAIFYETLLVILVSALTAAVCLSSYLVTKRKTMLYAYIAFMFYFFDVASILQDDYAVLKMTSGLTQEYYFFRSLYTMVTGAGFLSAFWFMVCEYVDERRRIIRIAPHHCLRRPFPHSARSLR